MNFSCSEYGIIEPPGGFEGDIVAMRELNGKLYVFTTKKSYIVEHKPKSKLRAWFEVWVRMLQARFKKERDRWRNKERS